jgi:hypothetical protein
MVLGAWDLELQLMASTAATAATMSAARFRSTSSGGSKRRKFLRKLFRAAMRAFRALPIRRTDQDFAFFPAFIAMKFVYWHGQTLFQQPKTFKPESYFGRVAWYVVRQVWPDIVLIYLTHHVPRNTHIQTEKFARITNFFPLPAQSHRLTS